VNGRKSGEEGEAMSPCLSVFAVGCGLWGVVHNLEPVNSPVFAA
jgi:hypothetical protein